MRLGCIADDLTGATDVALAFRRTGLSVVQTIGVPRAGEALPAVDVVVVALKSRNLPPAEAIGESLASLEALQAAGAERIFFKYCSTFDSTAEGNIGPVAEALMQAIGTDRTVFCPAFPATGRSIYQGHLFVNGELLSDSPMKDHPLTPMRDSSLVRLLAAQSRQAVGLVPWPQVTAGAESIAEALESCRAAGQPLVVLDALTEDDLLALGRVLADWPLVTGAAGLALGLAAALCGLERLPTEPASEMLEAPKGAAAILSGSCSAATRRQVAEAKKAGLPALKLDPVELAASSGAAERALAWALERLGETPVLIYATDEPAAVQLAQRQLGAERAGKLVEDALASIAEGLVAAGVRRLVVAGGESSGAVVQRLGVRSLAIGPEIDPGVPWTTSLGQQPLALALKSGNFGGPAFFLRAWDRLQ